jgi:putative transposase
MHSLNFRFASWFNAEYGHRGHTMAARYWARRIVDAEDMLTSYAYVARNPVEAFLCDRPEDWAWSSYAGTIGLREADSFVDAHRVLGCFDGSRELQVAELRRYVSGS